MNVLELENMLSYAPIRVSIASTGAMLIPGVVNDKIRDKFAKEKNNNVPSAPGWDEHAELSHYLYKFQVDSKMSTLFLLCIVEVQEVVI